MNNYFDVFIEALWTASIIPMSQEATYVAMRLFGGYNMPLAAALGITGATLGQLFNWWIGKKLVAAKDTKKFNVSDYWYDKISHIFNKYLLFLLLFCWAPLGGILLVIAGFIKTPLRLVLPIILVGNAYYFLNAFI